MTIAEFKTDRVVADALPTRGLNADIILGSFAAILMTEDIAFAAGLRAGGVRTERGHGDKAFGAILPADSDF